MVVKPRSPNYPSVDLETAVDLLRKLYEKVRKGEIEPINAAGAWGYNSASGPVKRQLAALRQYGLLEGKTRGKYAENPKISRRGLTLVLRNQASREFQDELRKAALAPPLFNETYNTLSDATDEELREHLIVEKGFTDNGAQLYIEVYRSTLQLVNLNKDGELSSSEYDTSNENDENKTTDTDSDFAPAGRETEMVKIPLSTEGEYALLLPGMTSAEWNLKVNLFKAYKDMLVQDETESPDST